MKKILFLLLLLIAFTSPVSATDWDISVSDEVNNGLANYHTFEGSHQQSFTGWDDGEYAYDYDVYTYLTNPILPPKIKNDFSQYGNFYYANMHVANVDVATDYTSENVSSIYDVPVCAVYDGEVIASGWVNILKKGVLDSSTVNTELCFEYFVLKDPSNVPVGWSEYTLKYSEPIYDSGTNTYTWSESQHTDNLNDVAESYSGITYAIYEFDLPGGYYDREKPVYTGWPNVTSVGANAIYGSQPDDVSFTASGGSLRLTRHYETDIHYYDMRTIDYEYNADETSPFADFRFYASGGLFGTTVNLTDSSGNILHSFSDISTGWTNYSVDRQNGVNIVITFPDGSPQHYEYQLDGDSDSSPVYYDLSTTKSTVKQYESTYASLNIGDPNNEYDAIYWFTDDAVSDRYKLEDSTWYRYVNDTWISTTEADAMHNDINFGSVGDHSLETKIFYNGNLKASPEKTITVQPGESSGQITVYALTPDDVLIEDAQATIEDLTNNETVYSDELIGDGLKFELDRYNDYEITVSASGYSDYIEEFSFLEDRTIYAYMPFSDVSGDDVQVTFHIKDSATLEPISDALVTFADSSKYVSSNGKVTYTVPKNSTSTYTISADGYFSESDDVSVTTSNKFISIEMTSKSTGGDTDDPSGDDFSIDWENPDDAKSFAQEWTGITWFILVVLFVIAAMGVKK